MRIGTIAALAWAAAMLVPCARATALEDDWSRLADAYLATPESDPESNALADYIKAYKLCDGNAIQKQMEAIRAILREGWPAAGNPALSALIDAAGPAMEAVRAGNAKPVVRYPVQMLSFRTKVWSNLQLTALGRVFELDAARRAASGDASGAVDSISQMLTFASRCTDESSPLLPNLIRIALLRSGAEGLTRIALAGTPDAGLCGAIMKALDPHLRDDERIAEAMEMECDAIRAGLENPLELISELEGSNLQLVVQLQEANDHIEEVLQQAGELRHMIPSLSRGPLDPDAEKKLLAAIRHMHPAVKLMVPNGTEARKRELISRAHIRLAWLAAAARARLAAGGPQPARVEELAPGSEAGVDPFTRAPMGLTLRDGSVVLHSTGPDLKNDGGAVVFDISKGNPSPGDVLVSVPWPAD